MSNLRTTVLTLLVVLAVNASQPDQEDTISKPDADSLVKVQDDLSENRRPKRQFYSAWTSNALVRVPVPVSIWQPQYYQIRRPYFIPVWGSPGRIPVYYPPQPLYLNPGFPIDNPPKKYPGLPYLPPDTQTVTPSTNDNSTKETDTKFGEGGPVWDQIPAKPSSTTVKPTRRTKRPGQSTVTHPPLVHKDATAIPNTAEKSAVSPIGTTRPPSSGFARPPASGSGPSQPPKETPVLTNQPSRCVWAIISCCSATSQHVSYSCFEQLGCTGAFWDTSPCDSEFARSAISAAMNYYNAK